MIFVAILLLVAGFVALVKGADVFVDGAAALAGKFGIPQLVIGLTIVAMGTSLPIPYMPIMPTESSVQNMGYPHPLCAREGRPKMSL